jgi:membrane fusion protein, multidrug efflux system
VEVRPLRVAATRDGAALITNGLSADDRVVVDGQYRLRPGARVVASVRNRADGEKTAAAETGGFGQ